MRFTPSDNWNLIASAAHRRVITSIYLKKTTDISEALSAGTWVDVTPFMNEVPAFAQQIEYELGQFSSSSVTLSGSKGMFDGGVVQWFKNNIFNASANQYVEMKATAVMKLGTLTTSDTFYAFSGFVDKTEVQYNELEDSVTFNVYTADELGNRISSLYLTTQYLNTSVDGAGTDGLVMHNIRGMYVIDAGISTFELSVGVHTITYDYNSGTPQAKLDDGGYSSLPGGDGTLTLVNANGLEKVQLYVDVSDLLNYSEDVTHEIVVTEFGATLPNQWYLGKNVRQILSIVYPATGITTQDYDTSFKCNTWDGNGKISYCDIPPTAIEYIANRYGYSLCAYGNDLFVSTGYIIYLRNNTIGTYGSALVTLGSTNVIRKMLYDGSNDHLWILYTRSGTNYARRYTVGTATLSSEVTLFTGAAPHYSAVISPTQQYGLVYINSATQDIDELYSSSMTVSTIWTGTAAVPSFAYFDTNSNVYRFQHSSGGSILYHELEARSSGWNDNGDITGNLTTAYTVASYHQTEGKVYLWNSVAEKIQSHPYNSATRTDILTLTSNTVECMEYGNSTVWFTTYDVVTKTDRVLYSAASGSASAVDYDTYVGPNFGMAYTNSRLYGLDEANRLFQYHTTVEFYIEEGVFGDSTLRDALVMVLQSHNLVGTLSSHKKAAALRRGDDSGAIQNSGNSMTLNITNVSDILQVEKAYQAVDYLELSNRSTTMSFDGTTYDKKVLVDARKMSISNSLINGRILKDLLTYFFTFYNADHDKYTFNVDAALMQYEVMDGADVTFSTTKIAKTATGLITGQSINPDGTMQVEVLF